MYGPDSPTINTTAMHQIIPHNTTTHTSLFLSGSRSMVSFEDVNNCGKRSKRPFFRSCDDDNVDEEYDEYFNQPEKKRRLSVDQVQFLEKSFEVENKLEPDRKVQLAKELGLQPRQVAIWFQNRRARWKTKQMEKDYDVLQSNFNSLKADYDALLKEKEKLNAEVLHLNDKLLLQEKEKTDLDQSDTEKSPKSPSHGRSNESASVDETSKNSDMGYKLEDISSAKSDVDSDSPRFTGGHSSLLEAGDTSYVDQSELSQDEEDELSKNYMLAPSPYVFPKIEDANYPDLPAYSCYYGFPAEDHPIDFWSY